MLCHIDVAELVIEHTPRIANVYAELWVGWTPTGPFAGKDVSEAARVAINRGWLDFNRTDARQRARVIARANRANRQRVSP